MLIFDGSYWDNLKLHITSMAIKTFKQYITEAPSSISAEGWERAIVIAFNGGWDRAPEKYGLSKAEYQRVAPTAIKIATSIKKQTGSTLRDQMLHFGTGAGEKIQMVNWWKGKNTPKTDCYTPSGVRVSLKKQGGSQLMSGFREETLSTFEAAKIYLETQGDAASGQAQELLDYILPTISRRLYAGQFNIDSIAQVADDIEEYTRLSPEQKKFLAVGGLKSKNDIRNFIKDTITFKSGQVKTLTDVEKKKLFAKAQELVGLRQEFRDISPKIADWFEGNPTFKLWFTYEAASGHMKFLPTPKASANWIVEFDPVLGTNNNINRLEARGSSSSRIIPSAYMEELAVKTSFRIGFKTGSGSAERGVTAGALRTGELFKMSGPTKVENTQPSQSTLVEYADAMWEHIAQQELLHEDIASSLKDIFSKVKDAITRWVNLIIKKLQEIAAQGLTALMNFLNLEPEYVEVDGIDMLFSES